MFPPAGRGDTINPDNEVDRIDLLILDALQDDLPLVPKPWKLIADGIGISELECIKRISRLIEGDIIRNISPIFESRRFGLRAGTLIALSVPEDQVYQVVEIINSYPEISHNYRRDHHYNIWFTISGRNEEENDSISCEICRRAGISQENMIALPTIRSYKIDVRFSCIPEEEEHEADR